MDEVLILQMMQKLDVHGVFYKGRYTKIRRNQPPMFEFFMDIYFKQVEDYDEMGVLGKIIQ